MKAIVIVCVVCLVVDVCWCVVVCAQPLQSRTSSYEAFSNFFQQPGVFRQPDARPHRVASPAIPEPARTGQPRLQNSNSNPLQRSVGQRLLASADCDLTTPIPSSTNNPGTQSRWYVRLLLVSSVSAVSRISLLKTPATLRCETTRRPRKHHSNNVSHPQVRYAATEIESAKSARARGSYLRVSFKNTRETAQAINGWKVTRALQYLENVKGHAEAVPMRRYAGSTGRTAQGT